ncbi:MAG: L-lysine 6-transaminase, partial [Candidatus Krumholzibacteria bacterium]|nr:L-lysine 6-transaminase [Candidatus Krumholzibacteria bacterium]
MSYKNIAPADVHKSLDASMLVDGYPFVLDLNESHGSWLVDAATGKKYLDFFTFFASSALGYN